MHNLPPVLPATVVRNSTSFLSICGPLVCSISHINGHISAKNGMKCAMSRIMPMVHLMRSSSCVPRVATLASAFAFVRYASQLPLVFFVRRLYLSLRHIAPKVYSNLNSIFLIQYTNGRTPRAQINEIKDEY